MNSPVKVGEAQYFQPKSNDNEAIKFEVEQYRTLVASRYQAISPNDINKVISGNEFQLTRKYDGEFWYLLTNGKKSELIAPNGRRIIGKLPILDLAEKLASGWLFAGELFVSREGKRERVGDISQILSQGEKADTKQLTFGVFDWVKSNDSHWKDVALHDRRKIIDELITTKENLIVIPSVTVKSTSEISSFYTEKVEKEKAEGIIVKSDDGRIFKVKPGIDLDVVVIGFTEREVENGSKEIRSLLTGLMKEDGTVIPIGATSNISESVSRVDLHKKLSSLVIPSQYRQSSGSGQLYQFCKPEVIIEIKAVDIQSEDSQARPIKQVALKLDDKIGWQVIGKSNAASLSNIFLVRIREDKPVDATSVRFAQISDYLPVSAEISKIDVEHKIIKREVWVKKTADKTDVRKLVVWKTNKEDLDPSYPAFVVHWTDYSSTRKAPLSREVRPLNDEKTALALAEEMITENIKKGWEKV
jgi:hypothetical protein